MSILLSLVFQHGSADKEIIPNEENEMQQQVEKEVRKTDIQDFREQENRKIQIAKEIDGIISEVCKEIKERISYGGLYTEEITALAKLVVVRALLWLIRLLCYG